MKRFSYAAAMGLMAHFAFFTPLPAQRQGAENKIEPLILPEVARDKVICFALYTADRATLKLSAFLYPLKEGEERKVVLEVQRGGEWKAVAEAAVEEMGWMALFRVEKWDTSANVPYRVRHAGGAVYEGMIRRDPVDKDEIVVGTFSCNGNNDRSPRNDILANIELQNPDLLFFAGGQCADPQEHYAAWLHFGQQFGEICRDRPVITLPGDQDLSHPNLWGEAGETSRLPSAADGGYLMPVPYVNMVQRAQCSHLPDPADPTPVKNGITVCYTSLNVGGIDFAILEDRKWKTGPAGLVPQGGPRPDHVTDPKYDRQALDVPEAELLGSRQVRFLRDWSQQWTGVSMKCVLSQTAFAGIAHLQGTPPIRLQADLDSNGWPQSGRNVALREMRRCFAAHLCGDQHLSAVFQYGVNQWGDAPWCFSAPAICSQQPRSWQPADRPLRRNPASTQANTGDYLDGFGNKVSMHAYSNATSENNMGNGYGLVRFRKSTRETTFELWKRGSDATRVQPLPGWPVTIRQEDNYARPPLAWLPTLKVSGAQNPVVQVVDDATGEMVYCLRINGTQFRPKVFREGTYTIQVGEGDRRATLTSINTVPLDAPEQFLDVIVP